MTVNNPPAQQLWEKLLLRIQGAHLGHETMERGWLQRPVYELVAGRRREAARGFGEFCYIELLAPGNRGGWASPRSQKKGSALQAAAPFPQVGSPPFLPHSVLLQRLFSSRFLHGPSGQATLSLAFEAMGRWPLQAAAPALAWGFVPHRPFAWVLPAFSGAETSAKIAVSASLPTSRSSRGGSPLSSEQMQTPRTHGSQPPR